MKGNIYSKPSFFKRADILESILKIPKETIEKKYNVLSKYVKLANFILANFSLSLKNTLLLNHQQITLESHGRSSRYTLTDPSTCIGWLTSIYPVEIIYNSEDHFSSANSYDFVEKCVSVKDFGIDYGLSVFKDIEREQKSFLPPILFNFLGDIDFIFNQDIFISGEFFYRYEKNKGSTPFFLELLCYKQKQNYYFIFAYNKKILPKSKFTKLSNTFIKLFQ